jgi:hypothetical protein
MSARESHTKHIIATLAELTLDASENSARLVEVVEKGELQTSYVTPDAMARLERLGEAIAAVAKAGQA